MTPLNALDDRVLVDRALRHQRGGATRIVAKYERLILGVVSRCLKDRDSAPDVAQETFCQAFLKLATLRDVGQFKGWLVMIARRLAWAHARHPVEVPIDEETSGTSLSTGQADLLEQVLRARQLRTLLDRLPLPYRTALTLRFYDDLPLAQVAERMHVSLALAKFRVRHGLKLLREKVLAAGVTSADH